LGPAVLTSFTDVFNALVSVLKGSLSLGDLVVD
jgi:hypothetical protein